MSKIEDMIREMCPEGVRWVKLGEVGVLYGGLSGKSKKDFENGNAKFITYKNVYANPALNIDVEDKVQINPGEKQNTVQYGDILFTGSSETPDECAMSSVLTTHTDEALYLNSFCFGFRFNSLDGVIPEFYKHYFRCTEMRLRIAKTAHGTTRFNVSKKEFAQLSIPLPPLPIQEKIVEILDKFSLLSAELEAELEGRRKQYDFYRNRLLSFDSGSDSVQWKALGEVFTLRNGYTPSKDNPDFWEGGTLPWFRMEDIRANGRILTDSLQHITPSALKKSGLFPVNSIIVATSATIGEHALIKVPSLANQRFTYLVLKTQYEGLLDMNFMFYYMFIVDEWCKTHTIQGNFAGVDMEAFRKLEIPVPPLTEQERIVRILDKFEALVTDLSAGLPAEIERVQKQYEYYRNKLLTF